MNSLKIPVSNKILLEEPFELTVLQSPKSFTEGCRKLASELTHLANCYDSNIGVLEMKVSFKPYDHDEEESGDEISD